MHTTSPSLFPGIAGPPVTRREGCRLPRVRLPGKGRKHLPQM